MNRVYALAALAIMLVIFLFSVGFILPVVLFASLVFFFIALPIGIGTAMLGDDVDCKINYEVGKDEDQNQKGA